MLLTPQEAEEQHPELLLQHLTQIDRQNRELLARIQESTIQQTTSLPRPDVQRTLTDALRSLSEPQTLLRELLTQPEASPLLHPETTPEVEAILRQADPATRQLYEAVLLYEKNPQAILEQGLLRPGAPMMLTALQAQAAAKPAQEALLLEHPAADVPAVSLPQQANSVLPLRREPATPPPPPPAAVSIVHKKAPPDVTEELLERLEQQRTQSAKRTETHDTVTHQHLHQTQLNEVDHQLVTQTTEDITELVNRTLARQMRTISDQVYHQMEKRLQTERSRRGRL